MNCRLYYSIPLVICIICIIILVVSSISSPTNINNILDANTTYFVYAPDNQYGPTKHKYIQNYVKDDENNYTYLTGTWFIFNGIPELGNTEDTKTYIKFGDTWYYKYSDTFSTMDRIRDVIIRGDIFYLYAPENNYEEIIYRYQTNYVDGYWIELDSPPDLSELNSENIYLNVSTKWYKYEKNMNLYYGKTMLLGVVAAVGGLASLGLLAYDPCSN